MLFIIVDKSLHIYVYFLASSAADFAKMKARQHAEGRGETNGHLPESSPLIKVSIFILRWKQNLFFYYIIIISFSRNSLKQNMTQKHCPNRIFLTT